MSEPLDEHGVLDAIENQKSWEELGFIKAGDEETIFIVSREDGYVARGATGILAFANTQSDAAYRLGRWEEEQAQAETMYALQAENVRLREQAAILQGGRCTSCMEPINPLNVKCQCVRNEFETLYFQLTECENKVSSIREQALALAAALEEVFRETEHINTRRGSQNGRIGEVVEAALRAYRKGTK